MNKTSLEPGVTFKVALLFRQPRKPGKTRLGDSDSPTYGLTIYLQGRFQNEYNCHFLTILILPEYRSRNVTSAKEIPMKEFFLIFKGFTSGTTDPSIPEQEFQPSACNGSRHRISVIQILRYRTPAPTTRDISNKGGIVW